MCAVGLALWSDCLPECSLLLRNMFKTEAVIWMPMNMAASDGAKES